MAPMLLDPPPEKLIHSETVPACSDPSILPPEYSSPRTKELWWLHGHPHSKRYSDPRLVSLAALVRHDGNVYRGQKGFLYPTSTKADCSYESMAWDEFDQVTEAVALAYARQLKTELKVANATRKQPTIALLGRGITLAYFCTQLALQKLGVRILLLAESNALNALHHLLESCNALAVVTDSRNSGADTSGIRKLDMIDVLPKGIDTDCREVDLLKFQDFGDVWERHTFIIHSSGSTGMPKPIIHTNRSMMLIARMYRLFQEFDVENWFLLFPLYHIAGISVALSNLPNGQILSFPPLSWPPSSSAIFSSWQTLASMGHPVDSVHCAPTLIENMYEYIQDHGGDFSPLTALKLLQPGGAALSQSVVKALTSNGVNVKTTYGSTEIGPPFRTIPHTRDNPRCYAFRNLYPDSKFLKMEEAGEGLYECVVYRGFELAAELWEGKPDDEPYRTNDLFIQDPPGSGFFVFQGRKDDILVHSNGENTAAGPLQLDIQSSSKLINKAVALGYSRPYVGLLVELHPEHHSSESALDQVWEAVQAVNDRYPKHSQVMRSMIRILPQGCTLPVTPKGNVKRKEVERIYAAEIEQLYSDEICPALSNGASTQPLSEYIRNLLGSLSSVPPADISDYTSFYDLGIDSRLALSLRTSLSSYLSRSVSLSTVFENNSITKLVAALSFPVTNGHINGGAESKPPSTETTNEILARLTKELASWPPRSTTKAYPQPSKEIILLTGASGSLGTALLETFSSCPSISKIYAMVRGPSNVSNLRSSLEKRGLDTSMLDNGRIEVLNFSMQDPLLGLDVEKYAKLAGEVTVVVQNAWKMDFNLGVREFEGDCLRNTMSLLRFAHAGRPKTFAFTSSISTCMGPSSAFSVPEEPIGADPTIALSTGYAQSKFIEVERLTQSAASLLSLPVKLLRIGQLCGHTRTGYWNVDEMWPIMFASSAHPDVSSIPEFKGKVVDWVPVDVAARTVSDVLLSGRGDGESGVVEVGQGQEKKVGTYSVHNIVNPAPILWSDLVSMLRSSLVSTSSSKLNKIEAIPMKDWVQRLASLAEAAASPNEVPGLRLLQFFESLAEEEGEEEGKIFETAKTQEISECLRECGRFNQGWINCNIKSWKEIGFLL
ncbi:uncharacterized protein PAC_03877 [Phialocephala subalpina]|uniref:Carrier domain-containing protein n=1 Tax=Phialocephala subalpina TaxID=576137 RepID=A0A1L7WMI2_9HELO|nr:uncharacterized protein PAC_03877 [Phialocephala subalpina]